MIWNHKELKTMGAVHDAFAGACGESYSKGVEFIQAYREVYPEGAISNLQMNYGDPYYYAYRMNHTLRLVADNLEEAGRVINNKIIADFGAEKKYWESPENKNLNNKF